MTAQPRLARRMAAKVANQRWRIAGARLRAERAVLARAATPRPRTGGRVLAYHSTGTPEWGVNDVPARRFTRQIEAARAMGYRFVPVSTVASGESSTRDLAITFDDGLASILAVSPYLAREGVPYTIFVVSNWASRGSEGDGRFLSWEALRELMDEGAEVGSHSVSHASFRNLTPGERREELQRSREEIRNRLGVDTDLFAIPFGRARDWSRECTELALKAGYRSLFAQSEDRRPSGTMPRSFVCKFDREREFRAVLEGRFDGWEEWF